jgi:pimeloyl-ACP methyl ester carboxylesterase
MPSVRAEGSEPPSGERTATCGLVLIHGGWHTAACWTPTVTALASDEPTLPVVAVDLPGRGSTRVDLRSLTLDQGVDSVIDQIERANLEEVVVAAHSMGGLSAPQVVARLGTRPVRRLVLIAAVIPPEGKRMLDLIPPPARWVAGWFFRDGAPPRRPPRRLFARWWFGNDLSREQNEHLYRQLCPEATGFFHTTVTRTDLPSRVPRTWILTGKDRTVGPRQQRRNMANLGRIDEIVHVDACHDVMISQPHRMAQILADQCGRTPTSAASSPTDPSE